MARITIRNLLNTSGIVVTTELDSGDQVVQTVEGTRSELLIIDMGAPSISGIEMLKQLRKRHYADVTIIISAKDEIFYGKRNAECGANGLVSKKEGMNNILVATETARNGYSYFPFSLEHFTGSFVSEQDKLGTLSSREMRVLRYILNDMDYSMIASKVNISNKTVSTYRGRLMEKLDCSSLIEIYDYTQGNKIG